MKNTEELKLYAARNAVPIINDEGCEFVISLAKKNRLYRILEIGTAIGYSTALFAKISPKVKVTTIELDRDRYVIAKQNFMDMNLLPQISAFNEDALQFQTNSHFDLIFIDASKAQYIKFFERFKDNLSPNGVIVSDNLFFHGLVENPSLTKNYSTIKLIRKIKKYLAFLRLNPEFNTEIVPIGDGISVSKKNLLYRNLSFTENERGHFTAKRDSKTVGEISFLRKRGCLYVSDFKILESDESSTTLKTLFFFAAKKTMENGFHSLYMCENCGGKNAEDFKNIGFEQCDASPEKLNIPIQKERLAVPLLEFKM